MLNSQPIGIFDSGAGGISVFQELIKVLPLESFVYFADSANCPYGSKSHSKIIELSSAIADFLISQNCKVIVVACNTATAGAIDWLRANYDIPFIGMEPAIKPASLNTKTKSIGVLATAGTFKGRLYLETSRKYASDVNVCYQVGEGLVELVEQGKMDSVEAEKLLLKYIQPMLDCSIDQLVLGCTHYPFFKPLLRRILTKDVDIIDPAHAVAKQTERVLNENNINVSKDSINQLYTFYSSGDSGILKTLLASLEIDKEIDLSKAVYFDYFKIPPKTIG
ncbi:MAG: glutamate racemase [Tenuifilaceae bacterium]